MTKKTILGQGAWYFVYGAGERTYIATTFTFDDANQLVSSTTDGVTTRYAYDAAGRMVREGSKTYRYGYLDKVLSVTDGDTTRTFTYHADGQLASATVGSALRADRGATPLSETETFLWDGLALIQRGDEQFMNEPHIGGGNPVASSKGTSYFNDALGTTVGVKKDGKYSTAALTAFGEGTDADKAFFTGKPMVEGLGHAFWMRNYRASLAKWQTADPMGYPDGWNQLAYCNNGVMSSVDLWGCEPRVVGHDQVPAPAVWNDMGWHIDDKNGTDQPCPCHWWKIDEYVYNVTIMQDFKKKRKWETIDGLEDWIKGTGMGLEITGGYMLWTGITTFPGAGITFAGLCFHTAGELLDYFNQWIEVPVEGEIRITDKEPTFVESWEYHVRYVKE